jgi:DNA-binding beta-propeller fold protein YncE
MNRVRLGYAAAAAMLFAFAVLGQAGRGGAQQAPRLDVEPLWPQPFPFDKHWALGSVTGVTVDSKDHIWVTHRGVDSLQTNEKGPTLATWAAECCYAAPQILEFDASGKLLSSWGGPGAGYQWPQNPSGIAVDSKGNVWIAAAGAPAAAARGAAALAVAAAAARGRAGAAAPPSVPGDAHVLKFAAGGKFALQIGTPGQSDGPDSKTTLSKPSALAIDEAANEVYVADTGNRRIVVFDANTGAYKRHWFGSGEKTATAAAPAAYDPAAPSVKSFRDVTCVKVASDGNVYVCDRASNRIQVFKKDGTFVKEAIVAKDTKAEGSVWDVAFSNDAQQRYLFVADGLNKTIWTLQRDTLTPLSRFGDGGRYPGQFYGVGSVAVDSKGNVYTGENLEGKRVQKWIYKGLGAPSPLN